MASRLFLTRVSGTSDPPNEVERFIARTAGRAGMLASIAVLAALLAAFVVKFVEFRDPFGTWREDLGPLLGTSWGTAWAGALGASLLAAFTFLAIRRADGGRPWAWAAAAGLATVLAAFPAATGHAQTAEPRSLALVADVLHVLGAGIWIGGLALVAACEVLWRRGRSGSLLSILVPRFSPIALAGAGTLVGTGVFAAVLHVGEPAALLETDYGRLLIAKVAVVALVLGFGARNWRRLTPALRAPGSEAESARPMRRSVLRELVLAQVVLLITAFLVRTDPGG